MITVVIPTYNEKDNISRLIPTIFALALPDLSIIVVDDSSPDGTADVVRQLQLTYSNIELIVRPEKNGLGPAYVAGFTRALADGADIIIEMDADWSHDPKYLPALIAGLKDADMILGSRYIVGGGIENWHWFRQLISRIGNTYARWMLRLPYRDLTGGFKAYRRVILEQIMLSSLSSTGYNFQIETTYAAHRAKARIVEVPIVFTERAVGASKFSAAIILESFWKVALLRFRSR